MPVFSIFQRNDYFNIKNRIALCPLLSRRLADQPLLLMLKEHFFSFLRPQSPMQPQDPRSSLYITVFRSKVREVASDGFRHSLRSFPTEGLIVYHATFQRHSLFFDAVPVHESVIALFYVAPMHSLSECASRGAFSYLLAGSSRAIYKCCGLPWHFLRDPLMTEPVRQMELEEKREGLEMWKNRRLELKKVSILLYLDAFVLCFF